MYELGILDQFLKRPHQEVTELGGKVGQDTVTIADFTHLPTHCRFLALMPQWDFLDFLTEQGHHYPTFHLRMRAEVTDLILENDAIVGVRARTPKGTLEVRAPLTIGADGRDSVVRERAGLQVINLGAPMDVMWMRIGRRPTDPGQTLGYVDRGKILVLLNRETYWQCAFVIAKGASEEIKRKGLESFRDEIASLASFLRDRLEELTDWKDISLLTVTVDRLVRWWRRGLLCIGDAAHAMSPIGGVGINLAIQDAVATANRLGPILLKRSPSESDLDAVQKRRSFPTRATQRMQIVVQNNVISRVLSSPKPLTLPWILRLLDIWPGMRRIPARVVGVGFRPEHVKTPEVHSVRSS
ncbi:MAG: FAD-dependent oxidoreductase [Terriglobales bacterium]